MTAAVVARVGRTHFALDLHAVDTVVRLPAWSMVQHRRPHVLGLLDVRGTAVPLLDLEGVLTGEARPARDGDVVILDHPSGRFAIVVDEVLGVTELDEDAATQAEAVRDVDGRTLVALDLGALWSWCEGLAEDTRHAGEDVAAGRTNGSRSMVGP